MGRRARQELVFCLGEISKVESRENVSNDRDQMMVTLSYSDGLMKIEQFITWLDIFLFVCFEMHAVINWMSESDYGWFRKKYQSIDQPITQLFDEIIDLSIIIKSHAFKQIIEQSSNRANTKRADWLSIIFYSPNHPKHSWTSRK